MLQEYNGDTDQKKYKKLNEIKIQVYDDELEMITDFFKIVKSHKLDFVGAWNLAFDMKTLEMRIIKLGGDLYSIMCPSEFPYQQVFIKPDTFNTDFHLKRSIFDITGYTQFICLLENFASIRATMGFAPL